MICTVYYHNQLKYSNIKVLSMEHKKQALKVKALRGGRERREPFWKSSPIHAIRRRYETNYSWLVFRHFQKYSCSKFVVYLDWTYSNKNYCVFVIVSKNGLNSSNFQICLLCFRFTKILSSAYAAQSKSSMATRKFSRSNSANSSKPVFANCYFICGKTHIQRNKNDLVTTMILAMLVEATKKAAAKEKICDFYF